MRIVDLRKTKPVVNCTCGHCGCFEYEEKKEIFKNGSIHIRATCLSCGCFIKWLPHSQSKIIKEQNA